MKILINDDLELVTRQLKYILEREFDYDIIVSNDSQNSLEIYRRESSINLILTDLMMPDMNGLEFAQEIQRIDRVNDEGTQKPTRMILITAVDQKSTRSTPDNDLLNMAILSGFFDEVISKPVNRNELVLCISKLITKDGNTEGDNHPSVESLIQQIDEAVPLWGAYELDAFKKYFGEKMEHIQELQKKLIEQEEVEVESK